jgi:ligand-binding sensor domain-containing protein/class 3 adenylate cyclase
MLAISSCTDVGAEHQQQRTSNNNLIETKGSVVSEDKVKRPRIVQLIPKQDTGSSKQQPKIAPADIHYLMKTIAIKDGIVVLCLTIDKTGNLWLGTQGWGLIRYDGKSFTTYSTAHGLAVSIVQSILQDSKGNLWIGTPGGVSKYDGKSFTTYTEAQGLVNNNVTSAVEDKLGNLWFGTRKGVSKYDGKSFFSYSKSQGLADNFVRSIVQDRSGTLWFGTGAGVSKFDGQSFSSYVQAQGLADNDVTSIFQDRDGNLWFGTATGGASKFDGRTFATYSKVQGLVSNRITSIFEDKTGNLWFATADAGISKYDGKSFFPYSTSQGLADNFVSSIVQDKSGALWFGTGAGLIKYDGFANFRDEKGKAVVAQNLIEDKLGNLWFSTGDGGVNKYDGNTFTFYIGAQGLPGNTVSGVLEDKAGNLWFSTNLGGVRKFDGKSFTSYGASEGLASNSCTRSISDRAGNLWFGTRDAGVSKFDGKSFTNYTTAQGLGGNFVYRILEDRAGNIWFGMLGGGVSKYDGKSFTTYDVSRGLASNGVASIVQDKAGNMWFGTDSGVRRFDGKSLLSYSEENGLSNNTVLQVITTNDDIIAFGTKEGMTILTGFSRGSQDEKSGEVRIPAQNNLSNAELKNYTPVFEIYNRQKGFPFGNVDYTQNGMYIDKSGTMWFSNGDADLGLVHFNFEDVRKRMSPPKVLIQAIKIDNDYVGWHDLLASKSGSQSLEGKKGVKSSDQVLEEQSLDKILSDKERDLLVGKFQDLDFDGIASWYPVPKNLKLPYNHNNITFDFAAIEPGKPEGMLYQYKLERDKDWITPTKNSTATFNNIFEGSYEFTVRAKSIYSDWSEPTTYTFKVLPPWYRTWWAYTLYAITTLTLLFLIYRWRTAALRKRQKFLEMMYQAAERFVPRTFLDLIGKQHLENVRLGDGTKRVITVLFNDIRNFTTMVENRSPEQAFEFANRYWASMGPVIREYGGYIDQYQGDAILAIFPDTPENAANCAIAMMKQLQVFNARQRELSDIPIDIGLGLSTGMAMLGVLGEEQRYMEGLMGDVANTAARIEGLNKIYGSHVLMSGETQKELLAGHALIRKVDKVYLKGKAAKTEVYEIIEWQNKLQGISLEDYLTHFYAAQQKYFDGDFAAALNEFQDCLKYNADDKVTLLILRRCEDFLKNGAPKDWDGTFKMLEK